MLTMSNQRTPHELVHFLFLQKNTWDNQVKGGKVFLAHSFEGFMVAWPPCFWVFAKRYPMVGMCASASRSPHSSQEAHLEEKLGSGVPFKGMLPMTWLPPTSSHLPNVH
jgi:hypothetical protein